MCPWDSVAVGVAVRTYETLGAMGLGQVFVRLADDLVLEWRLQGTPGKERRYGLRSAHRRSCGGMASSGNTGKGKKVRCSRGLRSLCGSWFCVLLSRFALCSRAVFSSLRAGFRVLCLPLRASHALLHYGSGAFSCPAPAVLLGYRVVWRPPLSGARCSGARLQTPIQNTPQY
ncbi:hypothetical protein NDU88_007105 [Pleurodeles waltl]|uniref:Uncharacterized protein n=1 Tax=Pleurodeles waltl TaxID=8319 RepID=A0AAV7URZ8_PLEWA|nr:hypothetical protein NDU88_007105 [Pleurodeles waltl]